MPTYRLDLAYNGSGFRGYAKQDGLRTVQGELERALAVVAGEVVTEVAGRTDAGVHASQQVVSFAYGGELELVRVQRGLNRMLNPEIAILDLSVAEDGFSARRSAVARRYRYVIDNGPVADPLQRHRAWWVPETLDVAAMNAAAAAFIGEHDFASLCRAAGDAGTVRRVAAAVWTARSPMLEFEVEATSFCHQMVRSMVALCVDVGRGKVSAAEVPLILEAKDRAAARGAAPPRGLALVEVSYP